MSVAALALVGCCCLSGVAQALPVVGSSTGTFENPTGPGGMVTGGVGTNDFKWGSALTSQSEMIFTGAPISTSTETLFKLGTLFYHNGTIYADTGADTVDLAVKLNLTSPAGVNQEFLYNMQLINTPNTDDPNASADYVKFPTTFPATSFNAGGVDYTLELLGFGNVIGNGFTGINELHVLEESSASADLFGRVTAHTPGATPEPTSLALLATGGLPLLGLLRRRLAV